MEQSLSNIIAGGFGDREPLNARPTPVETDYRNISLRWLSGSALTGLASVFLMGGALYAALDGRQNLAIPAKAYQLDQPDHTVDILPAHKGGRPALAIKEPVIEAPQNIFMVSTISTDGDQNVVKLKPFMHVTIPLAAISRNEFDYPAFNPLAIFSESGKSEPIIVSSSEQIYGANVEGEISLKEEPYPLGQDNIVYQQRKSERDIETLVRNTASTLDVGGTALASVSYFDSARFSAQDNSLLATPGLSITAENVSVASRIDDNQWPGLRFFDREARVKSELPITLVLEGERLDESTARAFANAIASNLSAENFLGDDRLLMTFSQDSSDGSYVERLERISVFRNSEHMVTIVQKENGSLVYAAAPDNAPQTPKSSSAPSPQLLSSKKLPNIYNAIYLAGLSEGLTKKTVGELIRIIAFDVDFRSAIKRSDTMELFLTIEDGADAPTEASEILYAGLTLGGHHRKYYRFPDPETGIIDYYDETGKSAKQFLIREPVPNGRFRSPFGMRRHPITRVRKMHWGVDWSAPRGTPILAAGNGVVEKAGWAGGYGRQTIIRHANGYKTSYNHQNGYARGIKTGVRVRQGQVIGYVGTSGLSTGPHLHYEMIVNGNKVNPLKIKLPRGKVFRDKELAAFEQERLRIDTLLDERRLAAKQFASN